MTGIHPRISINTISTWNWSLEQDIAALPALGVETITPSFTKFSGDPAPGIAALRASGLRCPALAVGGQDVLIEDEATTLAALARYVDAAAALGATMIYFVTGPSPAGMPTNEAQARFVATLGPARDYAAGKAVRLAVENNSVATRDTGFVHTVTDAVRLCRESGIGLTLELQNGWIEGGLDGLIRDNVDLLALVQVSDFTFGEPLRFNRKVPGDGNLPLEWMIGTLLDAGYAGYFDIELLGPAIEAEGYEPALRRSITWLTERLARWGV